MSIRQTVFQYHSSHLPRLIRLRIAAVPLKIDSFLDSGFGAAQEPFAIVPRYFDWLEER